MLAPKSVFCWKLQKCIFFSEYLILFIQKKNTLFLQECQLGHLWTGLDNPDDSGCLQNSCYACDLLVLHVSLSLYHADSDLVVWTDKQSELRLSVKTMVPTTWFQEACLYF